MTLAMSWDEWAGRDALALAARVRAGDVTPAELAEVVRAVAVITGRPARQAIAMGDLDALGNAMLDRGAELFVFGQYGNERWSSTEQRIRSPRPPAGLASFERELSVFGRTLWSWLGGAALLLLLAQTVLLRWALSPLRSIAREIGRIEGAILLLAADVLGRVLARPGEIQVGIVLAFIGAPFFIALIRRRRLAGP